MDFKHIQGWAEDHPLGTAAIIIGGGLALLYFLGFFSKSSGGGASSAGNPGLAQAYYAAEAAQTAAGTQLQIAQTATAAQTAQAQIAAQAATTINAQNTAASTHIADTNASVTSQANWFSSQLASSEISQNANLEGYLASNHMLTSRPPWQISFNHV